MGKVIDLTGQQFGDLTVLYQTEKPKNKSYSCAFWMCRCSCGVERAFPAQSLKDGHATNCGCKTAEKLSKRGVKDITGQRFGHLLVLEQVPKPSHCKSNGAYFKCKCDCGNEKIVMGKSLRNGKTKSCGCHMDQITDLTGRRFGHLVVEKLDNNTENRGNGAMWICRCDCGNFTSISYSNLLGGQQSCGCLISKGEEEIYKILIENNISFKTQYSFSDLKGNGGGLLRFDFAIFENNQLHHLIEFQGEQHSMKWSKYFDLSIQQHDKKKKEYCKEHNIPLICIPYSKLNHITKEDLLI